MSTQDRCIVCADRVIGSEIILGAPMELLRYVGQVKARLGLFAGRVHLTQDRSMVCAEYTIDMEIFWAHPMVVLVDVGQVEAHFG
jgi:hypothetical protein